MLRYYASHFPTVEINNTFYRMPAESMLTQWIEQVPDHFTFTLKAPRRITHDKRACATAESNVAEFLRRAGALGRQARRAAVPASALSQEGLPRLAAFLELLPREHRVAFEFRNDSWQDDEVYATLRARDAMLCVTDNDEGDTPFVATSDCGYVRLRRTFYSDDDLRVWAERIAARDVETTYVYFMHEDEALGTRFAQRIDELWRTGMAGSR